jgi:hypothetical protein
VEPRKEEEEEEEEEADNTKVGLKQDSACKTTST